MILPEMPSMSLDGKVALITGASSGIGQGAAVALAQTGAHVLCAARGERAFARDSGTTIRQRVESRSFHSRRY